MLRYRFAAVSALVGAGMLIMAPTVQAATLNFTASSAERGAAAAGDQGAFLARPSL